MVAPLTNIITPEFVSDLTNPVWPLLVGMTWAQAEAYLSKKVAAKGIDGVLIRGEIVDYTAGGKSIRTSFAQYKEVLGIVEKFGRNPEIETRYGGILSIPWGPCGYSE